jgi:hypothetical protein
LVTKPAFYFRQPYERRAQRYYNRGSIIGACNPTDFLQDYSGNRRFLIFRLEGGVGKAITWDYELHNRAYSAQIIAQGFALAESDFRASEAAEALIAREIGQYTPEDPRVELCEVFDSMVGEKNRLVGEPHRLWSYGEADFQDVLAAVSKFAGVPPRDILRELGRSGRRYVYHNKKYYGVPTDVACGHELLCKNDANSVLEDFSEPPF